MNVRTSSASESRLTGLIWNAVSIATAVNGGNFTKIAAPSFTVDKITTYQNRPQASQWPATAAGPNLINQIVLTVASGGICPAWCIPGAAVKVNVTIGGIPVVFSTVIRDVSSDGKKITFAMTQGLSNTLTQTFNAAALDAIAAGIVNSITLIMEFQKAMFTVPAGAGNSVLIAPTADANGANAPWFQTLTPGGSEYEITAPTGAKFDLADWWLQAVAGTPNISIRFA